MNQADLYEASVKTAVELAQEKSIKLRLKGLLDLKKILQTRYLYIVVFVESGVMVV